MLARVSLRALVTDVAVLALGCWKVPTSLATIVALPPLFIGGTATRGEGLLGTDGGVSGCLRGDPEGVDGEYRPGVPDRGLPQGDWCCSFSSPFTCVLVSGKGNEVCFSCA